MSFITDIRNVSESALGQLGERFADLPRPLLAAIGAGDFAVERLAELREAIGKSVEKNSPSTGDMREFAGDLPAKLQEAATDVVDSVQKLAAEAPAKTQQMVAELPGKVNELRESLTPEQLRAAVEGYTHLAGAIFGSLADRGDKTWSKVVATAGYDAKVVNTTAKSAAKSATGVVKRAATQVAEKAADADVKASAAKASSVHSENAAAARQTTAATAAKAAQSQAAKSAGSGHSAAAKPAARSATAKAGTHHVAGKPTPKPAPSPKSHPTSTGK